MMKTSLFHIFPREYSIARNLVFEKSNLMKLINRDNGRTDVFVSVYPLTDHISRKPLLDKVFFDLDERPFRDMLTLHEWALSRDILHYVYFSGAGYHIYLLITPNINFAKSALYTFHEAITSNLDIILDSTVRGDIRQLVRYPNTYNPKRKRFCIPVSEEMIYLGHDAIKELAKKQLFRNYIFGSKLLDISQYDKEVIILEQNGDILISEKVEERASLEEALSDFRADSVPSCVESLMKNPYLGHHKRMTVILYFKEFGLTMAETTEILRHVLSPDKYNHCVYYENQVFHVYSRDYYFPECPKMRDIAECTECGLEHPIYK